VHETAVGKHRRCGQIARAVAGNKADDARDLLRPRHPLQQDRLIEQLQFCRVVHRRNIDRSGDRARADADDENVMLGEFDPGRARQHAHAAFRQAVGGVAGHRPILVNRADVDDASAAALPDHLLGGDLRPQKRRSSD
jgi:hypothetical protein